MKPLLPTQRLWLGSTRGWVHGFMLLGLGSGMSVTASAQTPPARSTQIQPRLAVELYATQATGSANASDTLISVTPSIGFISRGANSQIDGQLQLSARSYLKHTQTDRIVPTGTANLRSEIGSSGLGLDAGLTASQVKSSVNAAQTLTPSTNDSYTNTQLRVSPFFTRQLDALTRATARMERSVLHTTQLGRDLAERPDAYALSDSVAVERRAAPLGFGASWQHQQTRVAGQTQPSLDEQIGRLRTLYAPTPELELGLIVGAANTAINGEKVKDTPRGWQAAWRPTERTEARGQVEQRFFGKSWAGSVNHRSPWFAMGLTADRVQSTYAATVGTVGAGGSLRALYDALLTTRIPNEADRRAAVDALIARRNLNGQVNATGDAYDTAATVRQSVTARVAFMGRRDIVTFAAGQTKTSALTLREASVSLLTPPADTKASFIDLQLNHQLTPQSALSAGLRWARAQSGAGLAGPGQSSRDFGMRASYATSLTPNTRATLGVQRQITHTPSTTSSEETALIAGLDHRF